MDIQALGLPSPPYDVIKMYVSSILIIIADFIQDWILNGIQNIIGGVIDWCCGAVGIGIICVVVVLLYFLKRKHAHA